MPHDGMVIVTSSISANEALSALAFLVDAGLDVPVEAAPRNWLAVPETGPLIAARAVASRPVAARPVTAGSSAGVADAAAAAFAVTNLAALHTAIADFSHPLRRLDMAPQLLGGATATGIFILCDQPELPGSPAALLRTAMLAAIGLNDSNCALAHRLPWPTSAEGQRRATEIISFAPFLARAFGLAPPRAILALGQAAAALAGDAMSLASARGRWGDVDGVPLLATCHPRLLLSQPERKRHAWADLQEFSAHLGSAHT